MRQRAAHVDVVLGTHNVHRAAELLRRRPPPRPDHRDPRRGRRRRPRAVPVGAAGPARDVATTPGSRSRSAATTRCAFCIVPAVRGPEISRPFADIVAEVERARRRRRHRGDAARPERQQLRARPRAGGPPATATPTARLRPLFADLLRAVGRGRRASAGCASRSPHPKDMRPETFAAMADDAGGVRAPAPTRCSRARDRVLAAMHRGYTAERYLERARRRPGAAIADLAVSHRHHRRLPRRDRRRLRAPRSRSWPRPSTTTPTRSSSRPGPAPRRPTMTERLRRPGRRAASASSACAVVVERSALATHRGPRRAGRGGARRGPEQARTRRVHHRAHPPEQARALPRRRGRCAPAPTPTSRSPAPRRTTSSAAFVEVDGRAGPAPHPHPRRRVGERLAAPPVAAASGPTASGKSAVAHGRRPAPSPASRSSRSTRCRCTGAWTSARPSRRRPSGPRCRTTCSTWSTRARTSRSREFQPRPTTRARPTSTARRPRALLVGGTGLYLRAVDRRPRAARARGRTIARRARGRARHGARCTPASRELDPVAAARMEPTNRRRVVRALEVRARQRAAVQLVRPGARPPTRRPTSCQVGLRWPRAGARPSGSSARVHGA